MSHIRMTTAQTTWDALLCEVDAFGNRVWRDESGKFHRESGPAIVNSNGSRMWLHNGSLHRTDGPAVIWSDGKVEYWIENRRFTKEQFNARKLTLNG